MNNNKNKNLKIYHYHCHTKNNNQSQECSQIHMHSAKKQQISKNKKQILKYHNQEHNHSQITINN
jgi:hypothetical protein